MSVGTPKYIVVVTNDEVGYFPRVPQVGDTAYAFGKIWVPDSLFGWRPAVTGQRRDFQVVKFLDGSLDRVVPGRAYETYE